MRLIYLNNFIAGNMQYARFIATVCGPFLALTESFIFILNK